MQLGTCGLDRDAHRFRFVGRQIVHHDNVARLERWNEHLLDIGQERIAAHRAIERHRRCHACHAQRTREGRRLPMPVRDRRHAPLAARCASVHPRHLGRGTGLVDEDQPFGIEISLPGDPNAAQRGDVGPVLLGCVRRFF